MMQYAVYDLCIFIKKKNLSKDYVLLVGSVAQNSLMSIKEIDIKHNKRYNFEGYLKTVQ
jgi:hypothetical protein